VQVHGHRRVEAPRNRFSRSAFGLKLGRKAARGLGLGGSAATIYSHSQERRDLFVLDHAADSRWARALFNSVERPSSRTGELSELFSAFYIKFRYLDSEHTPLPAAVERSRAIIVDMNLKQLIPLFAAAVFFLAAALPKPILIRVSREQHPHQLIARVCLTMLGLLALWGWYRIKS